MTSYSAAAVQTFSTSNIGAVSTLSNPALTSGPDHYIRANAHRVFNFEVSRHHNYVADGTRVHNRSILSFLSDEELLYVKPGTLKDEDGDESYDYVQLSYEKNGLAAGDTYYKQNDDQTAEIYSTFTDADGRLVQVQAVKDASRNIISEQKIVLTGAEFGEGVGRILTPYLTAALIGENASVFDKFAADTILGTFVQNLFEFAGGYVHDQIVSSGLQDASFDPIADHTFEDLSEDFLANAIDNSQAILTQWILAEVFEGLSTDEFGGKFLYLLANQGVNAVLDVSVHAIADDVLGLSDDTLRSLGISEGDLSGIFTADNIANLVFKASIGTVLPSLESAEAQITSSAITLGLNVFAGIGGLWGSVVGYIGGVVIDLFFDEDPRAYSYIGFDPLTGELTITDTTSHDGGNKALARSMANAFIEYLNGVVESAGSESNNLSDLSQALDLSFGHFEKRFRNGDGTNYASAEDAIQARIVDALKELQLNDGDVKIASAIAFVANAAEGADPQSILSDLSLRIQVAQDYEAYLADKGRIDALIAADPESTFTAGWTTTFLLAVEYGYSQDAWVNGDATSGLHRLSSGNDFADGGAGNDELLGFSGDDTIVGGAGDDLLSGAEGHDELDGQDGDDTLFGGGGDNILRGGAGVDEIFVGTGDNTVDGGSDQDLVTFFGAFADYEIVDHGNNRLTVTHTETGAVNELYDVEFIRFEDKVVTFDPTFDSVISGGAGDDLLQGGELKDAINGGTGDDTIYGFDGDDFLSGDAGDDQIFGGAGNDWVFGVLGNDLILGGAGNDSIFGGQNGDYIWGDDGNDELRGETGDDVLNGGAGDDNLTGGDGDDLLEGGDGKDTIGGGQGDDDIFGGERGDVLRGGNGDDSVHGGAGFDEIYGNNGDDALHGDGGNDTIYGQLGDDFIDAGKGHDQIFGGHGDDTVYGGDGNDLIFALEKATIDAPFVYNAAGGAGAFYEEYGADLVYAGAGNDQVALNNGGGIVFGESGDDTVYIDGLQNRIDGGAGLDRVIFQNANFYDAVWYKSEGGETGAILWRNARNGSRPDPYDFQVIVGVEEVQAANGKVLYEGYSYNNGTGNAKYYSSSKYTGFITLSNAAFADLFSEETLLQRRNVELAGTWAEADWEQLTDADDYVDTGISNYTFKGDQRINAGGGNDSVYGGSGSDQLNGEAGHDTLDGGVGADILQGGDGNDLLIGGSGDDTLDGGLGYDTIFAGSGSDVVNSGNGHDEIDAGSGHDTIDGGNGNDTINGGSGRDEIVGGGGADLINGGDGPDSILGGDGNDTIFGGDGGDLLDGGAQSDVIYGGLGVDSISGGSGDDTLYGEDGSDQLEGGDGADQLFGGAAADNLIGDEGNDYLDGGSGRDNLSAGAGDDTLVGGVDGDLLDGGSGTDVVDYSSASGSVLVNLRDGIGAGAEAEGDQLVNIENLIGSSSNDKLEGSDLSNSLVGGAGNDTLNGFQGDDTLDGGAGDDRLLGDAGNDTLIGQAGDDDLAGGAGNDSLTGDDGADLLSGGSGNDTLHGGNDDDLLSGEQGDDFLFGGDGDDIVIGGLGDDQITGGNGNDILTGGAGRDTFVFKVGHGVDNITDFEAGADVLNFEGYSSDDVIVEGEGANTLVTYGGEKVYLIGVDVLSLSEDDFLFS